MKLNPAFETQVFAGNEYIVIHQSVGKKLTTMRFTPQQASVLGVELLRLSAMSTEWSPVAKPTGF